METTCPMSATNDWWNCSAMDHHHHHPHFKSNFGCINRRKVRIRRNQRNCPFSRLTGWKRHEIAAPKPNRNQIYERIKLRTIRAQLVRLTKTMKRTTKQRLRSICSIRLRQLVNCPQVKSKTNAINICLRLVLNCFVQLKSFNYFVIRKSLFKLFQL